MYKNNFDFLRLLFATFVIVTHSYTIVGIPDIDWIYQISGGQTHFSYIGVRGFFIISGFLIYQSLVRSKSLEDYYWKRFLRLFPALFVMLLLTTLLGYFVYENTEIPYWRNETVWSYLPHNITLFHLQYSINGVFENNPYPSQINASLWTIPYEVIFYIVLSVLFFIKNEKSRQILLGIGCGLLIAFNILFLHRLGRIGLYVNLGPFFFGGAFLASVHFEKNIKQYPVYAIIGCLLLIIFTGLGYFSYVKFLLIPLILYVGMFSTPYLSGIGKKIGDLSYGIYIYAFPVQQTLIHLIDLNYLELMLSSFFVTLVLAFLSWHVIEKSALEKKKTLPSVYLKKKLWTHIRS
ncbi:O-antigen acetylase [Bacteroidia bacterium]|nr:O-antigen acetylase [Bacteroidia bacterium]